MLHIKYLQRINIKRHQPQKLRQKQEYLEMINHWEMVYGKGMENDRKQL